MSYRTALDNDLRTLHVQIIKMGTLIEKSIDDTIQALINQDVEMAKQVIEGDDRFDDMERLIESNCVSVIARQQPVASDLRKITSILKIVTDLERIADHCSDVSKLTLHLAKEEYVKPLIDIPKMSKQVKEMLKLTIDCYIDLDVDKGKRICKEDDIVDNYYKSIREELEMIMKERPGTVRQCIDFLLIAKYLERMADHITNVAEWVIYSVEGERYDRTE
ncbi:phosphate signaling complex protein PhoU [Fusibacter paucivorans]|uniref:Phosphate-specific transport system accessory protein PhoU n=1 Tax=Fusibacter paucivorans TaxID=76009 RepID=A0ABS5PMM8_9FIRM|nr:phosphate signaling complex protein PhoU [Fusibacter paucivorans]MBS7526415.1 phosphate signaling complex protein PhoU [Fusibacter paucivorans]